MSSIDTLGNSLRAKICKSDAMTKQRDEDMVKWHLSRLKKFKFEYDIQVILAERRQEMVDAMNDGKKSITFLYDHPEFHTQIGSRSSGRHGVQGLIFTSDSIWEQVREEPSGRIVLKETPQLGLLTISW